MEELKIHSLQITDLWAVDSLELDPEDLTVISGGTATGKTSILKAIAFAFQGGGTRPEAIRHGAEEGTVEIDLGDIRITRTAQPDKPTKLKVERRVAGEGGVWTEESAAQTFLDELVGPAKVFSPVEFLEADTDEQRELLLQAIPITVGQEDLSEWFNDEALQELRIDTGQHGLQVLQSITEQAYDNRRAIGRAVREAEENVRVKREEIPDDFDAAEWEGVDVSSLNAEIREAGRQEERRQDLAEKIHGLQDQKDDLNREAEQVREKIAALEARLEEIDGEQDTLDEQIAETTEEREAIEVPDTKDAEKKLDAYTDAQAIMKDIADLKSTEERRDQLQQEHDLWDRTVEVGREKPADLLADAEIPLEGLQLDGDEIRYQDTVLGELSDGEQLQFAVDVLLALSDQTALDFVFVDGLERLDSDHRKALVERCQAAGKQVVATLVTEGARQIESQESI